MAKRVVYQIDPKRRNPDGSFPDFVFNTPQQKDDRKKWLHRLYLKLAYHAGCRNLPFGLPFLSFINFCRQTNYHILRGPRNADLTIDRKDNLLSYSPDNIQALTRAENVRKYYKEDRKLGKREAG